MKASVHYQHGPLGPFTFRTCDLLDLDAATMRAILEALRRDGQLELAAKIESAVLEAS